MLTEKQIHTIQPKFMLIVVLCATMILSVLVFATVVCVLTDWENLNDRIKMLTLFAAGTGIVIFGLSTVVPAMSIPSPQLRNLAKPDDETVNAMAGSLLTENLTRYMMVEGGIFLNLMVFLIEPHTGSLVIAGIGLLLQLVCFPRPAKLVSVIENRIGG